MGYRELIARKFGAVGACLSVIPFLLFGLIVGAKYGLETGSGIANVIFSANSHIEILDRFIIGGSMISGIVISGALLATLCFSVFWLAGYLVGYMIGPRDKAIERVYRAADTK